MPRARIGDVAEIPLDETRVAYVHLLANHPALAWYVGVLDGAHPRTEDPPLDAGYVLLAHTDDDQIRNGEWPVVGRVAPDESKFTFPRFKRWDAGPDGPTYVVTWDEQSRVAEPDEVPVLLPMTTSNSSVIEWAARALHGLAPWHEAFEDMRPERVERSHGRGVPDGRDPRPIAPRQVDPDARTELIAILMFDGDVERARAAGDQLAAGGWHVTVTGQLVEATRRVAWKNLTAAREEAEALAERLGADDFGYEVALPDA